MAVDRSREALRGAIQGSPFLLLFLDHVARVIHALSPETSGHVIVGSAILRRRENLLGRPHLHQLTHVPHTTTH